MLKKERKEKTTAKTPLIPENPPTHHEENNNLPSNRPQATYFEVGGWLMEVVCVCRIITEIDEGIYNQMKAEIEF